MMSSPNLYQLKAMFEDNIQILADILNEYLIDTPKQLTFLNIAISRQNTSQIINLLHQLAPNLLLLNLTEEANQSKHFELYLAKLPTFPTEELKLLSTQIENQLPQINHLLKTLI